MTLARLPQRQATELTHQVAQGKALPAEVVAQIVAKTDGVPLFVEELTKTVLESGLLQEQEDHYALTGPLPPLAIPVTLHDSLLARLDRLGAAKGLAQLGATLGREFAYALLQAVAPWDEATVRRGLQQLVEAELLYQRGLPPQATYVFKHALIQEAAYQSLLQSTRQQYHQHIAQVLEAQFPETRRDAARAAGAPLHRGGLAGAGRGLLAAGRAASHPALGQPGSDQHLTRDWRCWPPCLRPPRGPSRSWTCRLTLGPALVATKGYAAPEVEQTYARARALCAQVGDTPQLFPVLRGLWRFYRNGEHYRRRGSWGNSSSAWRSVQHDPALSWRPMTRSGSPCSTSVNTPRPGRTWSKGSPSLTRRRIAPWLSAMVIASWGAVLGRGGQALWCLGYPDQAVQRSQEALALAQELAHPLVWRLPSSCGLALHHLRREAPAVQEQAEALADPGDRAGVSALCGVWHMLARLGAGHAGPGRGGPGADAPGAGAILATGQELARPLCLVLLAEATGQAGQVEEGCACWPRR